MSASTRRARRAATSPQDADAQLIGLCDKVHANCDRVAALMQTRITIADEHRSEPALSHLFETERAILDQIWKHGTPDTVQGARAVARLSLRLAGEGQVAELELLDAAGWLAVDVLRFVAALEFLASADA